MKDTTSSNGGFLDLAETDGGECHAHYFYYVERLLYLAFFVCHYYFVHDGYILFPIF